ncbi:MAG: phosphomannomutase/phosphoglucomutase, partial [Clostridiales bacterium]|nr:phosphomannomutase/phosphoglucomutase [Clostridiales bacterium]
MSWVKLKSGSDVRGVAMGENAQLTPKVVENLSKAFVEMVGAHHEKPIEKVRISIGHDSRLTGKSLSQASATGIASTGA